MGMLWPKNWKKAHVFACNCVISSHRIKCNTSFESFYERLHFFFYTDDLWALYEDIMTCQNFLFFVTSSILHIETCMIPLSKAVHKGFISFSYT